MADFYVLGARLAPVDIRVAVDGGAGVIWLNAIADDGPNYPVIDPAESGGDNYATAASRIDGPSDKIRYLLQFYCVLDTDGPGADVYLLLSQDGSPLSCVNHRGEPQPAGDHGVKIGQANHHKMFQADFRVFK